MVASTITTVYSARALVDFLWDLWESPKKLWFQRLPVLGSENPKLNGKPIWGYFVPPLSEYQIHLEV